MIPTNDIERFKFLKMHAPPACDDLLKKIYSDIDQKRIEILEAERFINLSLLTRTKKYPVGFMPPRDTFISMLETQVLLTSEEIDPSFVQHTSLLISYVYSNIDQLVKGVAEMSDSEVFPFIVSSMLPSIFGFFISAEYMQYAVQFYKTFIRTQKHKLSLIVIQPFFFSISTYLYIENVMEAFLIKFGTESIPKNEPFPQEFMNKYSKLLTKLLIEAMPLLPAAFFEIFKTVLEDKWSKTHLVYLFFDSFLRPQFVNYLQASPFSEKRYVHLIIDNIAKNDIYFTQIFNSWYMTIPKHEILPIFTPFKQVFVTLFLSIADVQMATECCLKGGKLPSVLDDINCTKYGDDINFNPFLARIYTKELKALQPKVDPLIIPFYETAPTDPNFERTYRAMKSVIPKTTTVYEELIKRDHKETDFVEYALQKAIAEKQNQLESLENYLVAKYYHNLLIDLREIVRSREDFIKIPFVLKNSRGRIMSNIISKNFLSIHAKRVIFFNSISRNISLVYNELRDDFRNLIEKWEQLSLSRKKNRELGLVNTMSNSRQLNFWQAVNIVSCLISVPISRSFELLMKALKVIHLINAEKFNELLRTLMIFSKSKYVPFVFEILNEFAIKNPTFKAMLDEEEYVLWLAFERFLLAYSNANLDENETNETRDIFININYKIINFVRKMKENQTKKKTSNFKEKTAQFFEKKLEQLKKEQLKKEQLKKEKQQKEKLKKEQQKREKLEKLKLKKEKQIIKKKEKESKQKAEKEDDTEDTTEEGNDWNFEREEEEETDEILARCDEKDGKDGDKDNKDNDKEDDDKEEYVDGGEMNEEIGELMNQ